MESARSAVTKGTEMDTIAYELNLLTPDMHAVMPADHRALFDAWVNEQLAPRGYAVTDVYETGQHPDGSYHFGVYKRNSDGKRYLTDDRMHAASEGLTIYATRPCPVDIDAHLGWVETKIAEGRRSA